MAMAKRQGRKKPTKIEKRNVQGPEWEPQVKQTALLGGPVDIKQAQGEDKKHKKRSQNWVMWITKVILLLPRDNMRILLYFILRVLGVWIYV